MVNEFNDYILRLKQALDDVQEESINYLYSEIKKRKDTNKIFTIPKKCLCGSKIIKVEGEAVQRCSERNNQCKYQNLESFKHFVSKKAMNIDGLGEKLIERFINLNLMRIMNTKMIEEEKLEKEFWMSSSCFQRSARLSKHKRAVQQL